MIQIAIVTIREIKTVAQAVEVAFSLAKQQGFIFQTIWRIHPTI